MGTCSCSDNRAPSLGIGEEFLNDPLFSGTCVCRRLGSFADEEAYSEKHVYDLAEANPTNGIDFRDPSHSKSEMISFERGLGLKEVVSRSRVAVAKQIDETSDHNFVNCAVVRHHAERTGFESDLDNETTEVPPPFVRNMRRGAVLAERPGNHALEIPRFTKDAEVSEILQRALNEHVLFNALKREQIDEIVQTMEVQEFGAGECIFHQGDEGDALFVVVSGTCDCYREVDLDFRTLVVSRPAGTIFGEMAIAWNQPRALSVYAAMDSSVARLDRLIYKHLVVHAQIANREQRTACLRKSTILETLEDEQICQLADSLRISTYEPGEAIIQQGEEGTEFFIVQSGECVAKVKTVDETQEHLRYKAGDLFGEVALLKNSTRQATVEAVTRVETMSIDRRSFERLLGPLRLLQEKQYLSDPRKLIADFYRTGDERGPRGSVELMSPRSTESKPTVWFAVFRPTSTEAIARMLSGSAVGKGLNIKGKSAKKNRLSGFVPFVQISDNADKHLIETMPAYCRVRIFFKTQAARTSALDSLDSLLRELQRSRRIFDAWILQDDEYEPESFGLDVPGELMYQKYIMDRDLVPSMEWETGRSSQPAYMDMNLHALCYDSQPPVVLYQSDEGDPMNPLGLLMAYAEKSVKPVVSDFDAFLVGSKGMVFEQLPEDQMNLVKWSVDRTEELLSQPSVDAWASRWIKILERERKKGIRPVVPRYGFGDPTSYRLICDVVDVTKKCGAVRHGAECFNFFFPTDLDEEYLVIWDQLPEKPWTYLKEVELRAFLIDRVYDGFSFPVNPVWPLRDEGWFDVLEALLQSEEAQANLEAWFPAQSGILQRVVSIHRAHKDDICVVGRTTTSGGLHRAIEFDRDPRRIRSSQQYMDFALGNVMHDSDRLLKTSAVRKFATWLGFGSVASTEHVAKLIRSFVP